MASTSTHFGSSKPMMSPPASSPGPKGHDDIFRSNQWRDLWAAILFYISLAGFLAIAGINISYLVNNFTFDPSKDDKSLMISLIASAAPAVGISFVLSGIFLLLIHRFPEGIIHFSYISLVALTGGVALVSLFSGSVVSGIIDLLMAGLTLLLYFLWKKYIPFSAVLLRWTSRTVGEYPAILGTNFGIMLLLVGKTVLLFASMIGGYMALKADEQSDGFYKATTLYSVFWFFWTEETLSNLSRVVASGVFACRYFLGKDNRLAPSPTLESFKRATTYSFGSICFGSLLVSILTFLRYMLNTSDDRNSLAGAVLNCILSIMEDLLRYFNTYAFTQVAIYGKPYIEAAKSTWQLIQTSGVGAIVNDNLIGSVLAIGSLAIGLLSGVGSLTLFHFIHDGKEVELYVIAYFIGVIAATLIASCCVTIISAGVSTFYVCLAEDPSALRRTDPETHRAVASKYGFINL